MQTNERSDGRGRTRWVRSTGQMGSGSRRLSARRSVVAVGLGIALLAGCGSDDETAQDEYCAAGDSLESSLGGLTDLDVVAEGTDGLNAAVEKVSGDLGDLREAASGAAADDVSALQQAVDELKSAVSGLGGDLTTANAGAVGTAIRNVSASAQAVYETLADC